MNSIMQCEDDGQCYLCMALHGDYSRQTVLEEHHVIYGHGKRKLSERYGLKVYLCPGHHQHSPEAVHHNYVNGTKYGDFLKQQAQRQFMRFYPKLNFMEIFWKNYLDQEEVERIRCENAAESKNNAAGTPAGFILLED